MPIREIRPSLICRMNTSTDRSSWSRRSWKRAPVERDVYLPEGQWLDYEHKNALFSGGRRIRISAPLTSVPVFVREGGIIPRGDILKGNNTWSKSWAPRLRVEVFPSSRFASEFLYYTGRGQRHIRSRPAPAGLVLEVDELEARTQIDVCCHRPSERHLERNAARGRHGLLVRGLPATPADPVVGRNPAGATRAPATSALSVF